MNINVKFKKVPVPESYVDGHLLPLWTVDRSENELSSAKANRKVVKSGRLFPRDDFGPFTFDFHGCLLSEIVHI